MLALPLTAVFISQRFVVLYARPSCPSRLSHLLLLSYLASVEAYLLNLTMNRPWLTPEDYKPVNDRVERLKVGLSPL